MKKEEKSGTSEYRYPAPAATTVPVGKGDRAPHKAQINAHGKKIKALVAQIRQNGGSAHDEHLAAIHDSAEHLESFDWSD
jgi:hypothetical protein